jgi:magnesium transporter
MTASASRIDALLGERFLIDFPAEAARELESLPVDEATALLGSGTGIAIVRTWERLAPDVAVAILVRLPAEQQRHLLTECDPVASVAALSHLQAGPLEQLLGLPAPTVARELRELLAYPADTAGRIMDPRVGTVRAHLTVAETIERLRTCRQRDLSDLFVVDDDGRLVGRVLAEDLVLADPALAITAVQRPLVAAVKDLDPREDVVETLHGSPVSVVPVLNQQGRLLGVIRQAQIMEAVRAETSIDMQTMVGASADERALSSPMFAVRKRLPWLQINLLTAFLAAAVVGLFEGVIAKVTALAILLPVVAGQSGNAGAQALAVTMRGLVLREVGVRQWPRVVMKEAAVGLINGLAVAATTAIGVYVWSRSLGLVLVIVLSMIISMVAAGLAGALVPIVLRRVGQDPATASSIILTTVTDVIGFFSFLGIATLLISRL